MGDINVYTGPMKCGKSEKILSEFNRQVITGKDVKLFKPSIDNRDGDNSVGSRFGSLKKDAISISSIEDLSKYDADVYFIDEFQFLDGNVKVIEDLAEKGKRFYIAGLNLTAEKKIFGKMGDLMCIADNIDVMKSICEVCKCENAVYTYYKGKKDCDIVIGDADYIPVCRKCYNKLMQENY